MNKFSFYLLVLSYHFRYVTSLFQLKIIIQFDKNIKNTTLLELETTSIWVPRLNDYATSAGIYMKWINLIVENKITSSLILWYISIIINIINFPIQLVAEVQKIHILTKLN